MMLSRFADALLVALLVVDLYMVSTSRIAAAVRGSVLQALILAALPFALGGIGPGSARVELVRASAVATAMVVVKGWFIPRMLLRTAREQGLTREFAPYVSLHYSQLVNALLCGSAFWIADALPWPAARGHSLDFGVGLATLLIGLYMTINRRKALSQVLGYIVAESALFVIGWALLGHSPLLVELGTLLDLLVAVMVMGVLATRLGAPLEPAAPADPQGAAHRGEVP